MILVIDLDLVDGQTQSEERTSHRVTQATQVTPVQEMSCDYESINEAHVIINQRPKAVPYPRVIYSKNGEITTTKADGFVGNQVPSVYYSYNNSDESQPKPDEEDEEDEDEEGAPVHPAIASYQESEWTEDSGDEEFPVSPFIDPGDSAVASTIGPDKGMYATYHDRTERSCPVPDEGQELTKEQREANENEFNRSFHSVFYKDKGTTLHK